MLLYKKNKYFQTNFLYQNIDIQAVQANRETAEANLQSQQQLIEALRSDTQAARIGLEILLNKGHSKLVEAYDSVGIPENVRDVTNIGSAQLLRTMWLELSDMISSGQNGNHRFIVDRVRNYYSYLKNISSEGSVKAQNRRALDRFRAYCRSFNQQNVGVLPEPLNLGQDTLVWTPGDSEAMKALWIYYQNKTEIEALKNSTQLELSDLSGSIESQLDILFLSESERNQVIEYRKTLNGQAEEESRLQMSINVLREQINTFQAQEIGFEIQQQQLEQVAAVEAFNNEWERQRRQFLIRKNDSLRFNDNGERPQASIQDFYDAEYLEFFIAEYLTHASESEIDHAKSIYEYLKQRLLENFDLYQRIGDNSELSPEAQNFVDHYESDLRTMVEVGLKFHENTPDDLEDESLLPMGGTLQSLLEGGNLSQAEYSERMLLNQEDEGFTWFEVYIRSLDYESLKAFLEDFYEAVNHGDTYHPSAETSQRWTTMNQILLHQMMQHLVHNTAGLNEEEIEAQKVDLVEILLGKNGQTHVGHLVGQNQAFAGEILRDVLNYHDLVVAYQENQGQENPLRIYLNSEIEAVKSEFDSLPPNIRTLFSETRSSLDISLASQNYEQLNQLVGQVITLKAVINQDTYPENLYSETELLTFMESVGIAAGNETENVMTGFNDVLESQKKGFEDWLDTRWRGRGVDNVESELDLEMTPIQEKAFGLLHQQEGWGWFYFSDSFKSQAVMYAKITAIVVVTIAAAVASAGLATPLGAVGVAAVMGLTSGTAATVSSRAAFGMQDTDTLGQSIQNWGSELAFNSALGAMGFGSYSTGLRVLAAQNGVRTGGKFFSGGKGGWGHFSGVADQSLSWGQRAALLGGEIAFDGTALNALDAFVFEHGRYHQDELGSFLGGGAERYLNNLTDPTFWALTTGAGMLESTAIVRSWMGQRQNEVLRLYDQAVKDKLYIQKAAGDQYSEVMRLAQLNNYAAIVHIFGGEQSPQWRAIQSRLNRLQQTGERLGIIHDNVKSVTTNLLSTEYFIGAESGNGQVGIFDPVNLSTIFNYHQTRLGGDMVNVDQITSTIQKIDGLDENQKQQLDLELKIIEYKLFGSLSERDALALVSNMERQIEGYGATSEAELMQAFVDVATYLRDNPDASIKEIPLENNILADVFRSPNGTSLFSRLPNPQQLNTRLDAGLNTLDIGLTAASGFMSYNLLRNAEGLINGMLQSLGIDPSSVPLLSQILADHNISNPEAAALAGTFTVISLAFKNFITRVVRQSGRVFHGGIVGMLMAMSLMLTMPNMLTTGFGGYSTGANQHLLNQSSNSFEQGFYDTLGTTSAEFLQNPNQVLGQFDVSNMVSERVDSVYGGLGNTVANAESSAGYLTGSEGYGPVTASTYAFFTGQWDQASMLPNSKFENASEVNNQTIFQAEFENRSGETQNIANALGLETFEFRNGTVVDQHSLEVRVRQQLEAELQTYTVYEKGNNLARFVEEMDLGRYFPRGSSKDGVTITELQSWIIKDLNDKVRKAQSKINDNPNYLSVLGESLNPTTLRGSDFLPDIQALVDVLRYQSNMSETLSSSNTIKALEALKVWLKSTYGEAVEKPLSAVKGEPSLIDRLDDLVLFAPENGGNPDIEYLQLPMSADEMQRLFIEAYTIYGKNGSEVNQHLIELRDGRLDYVEANWAEIQGGVSNNLDPILPFLDSREEFLAVTLGVGLTLEYLGFTLLMLRNRGRGRRLRQQLSQAENAENTPLFNEAMQYQGAIASQMLHYLKSTYPGLETSSLTPTYMGYMIRKYYQQNQSMFAGAGRNIETMTPGNPRASSLLEQVEQLNVFIDQVAQNPSRLNDFMNFVAPGINQNHQPVRSNSERLVITESINQQIQKNFDHFNRREQNIRYLMHQLLADQAVSMPEYATNERQTINVFSSEDRASLSGFNTAYASQLKRYNFYEALVRGSTLEPVADPENPIRLSGFDYQWYLPNESATQGVNLSDLLSQNSSSKTWLEQTGIEISERRRGGEFDVIGGDDWILLSMMNGLENHVISFSDITRQLQDLEQSRPRIYQSLGLESADSNLSLEYETPNTLRVSYRLGDEDILLYQQTRSELASPDELVSSLGLVRLYLESRQLRHTVEERLETAPNLNEQDVSVRALDDYIDQYWNQRALELLQTDQVRLTQGNNTPLGQVQDLLMADTRSVVESPETVLQARPQFELQNKLFSLARNIPELLDRQLANFSSLNNIQTRLDFSDPSKITVNLQKGNEFSNFEFRSDDSVDGMEAKIFGALIRLEAPDNKLLRFQDHVQQRLQHYFLEGAPITVEVLFKNGQTKPRYKLFFNPEGLGNGSRNQAFQDITLEALFNGETGHVDERLREIVNRRGLYNHLIKFVRPEAQTDFDLLLNVSNSSTTSNTSSQTAPKNVETPPSVVENISSGTADSGSSTSRVSTSSKGNERSQTNSSNAGAASQRSETRVPEAEVPNMVPAQRLAQQNISQMITDSWKVNGRQPKYGLVPHMVVEGNRLEAKLTFQSNSRFLNRIPNRKDFLKLEINDVSPNMTAEQLVARVNQAMNEQNVLSKLHKHKVKLAFKAAKRMFDLVQNQFPSNHNGTEIRRLTSPTDRLQIRWQVGSRSIRGSRTGSVPIYESVFVNINPNSNIDNIVRNLMNQYMQKFPTEHLGQSQRNLPGNRFNQDLNTIINQIHNSDENLREHYRI